MCNDVGLTLGTLKNYLLYAEQTFVISLVRPFYSNPKKELTKSPTIYFNDVGMCRFGQGQFGRDFNESTSGFIFQSFVFSILKQRFETGVDKINYWRSKDKAEVDFIIHRDGKAIPIEVKYAELKSRPSPVHSEASFNAIHHQKLMW